MKKTKIQFRRLFVPAVLAASLVLMFNLVTKAPSEAQMDLMKYAKEKEIAFL